MTPGTLLDGDSLGKMGSARKDLEEAKRLIEATIARMRSVNLRLGLLEP